MELLHDLWALLRARRKLWLLPLLLVLVGVTALLLLAESTVVGPFFYALF